MPFRQLTERLIRSWEAFHTWGTAQFAFQRFTELLRVGLSAGFFGPGMVKLMGHRFADLDPLVGAGRLFEALYQTEPYWRFIGLAQVAAALLLAIPAFAPLGNLLFLVVIANIFVITHATHFGGTALITTLMLLGSVYLLLWDYPRWKLVLPGQAGVQAFRPKVPLVGLHERAGYLLCTLSGWLIFTVARGFLPPSFTLPSLFGTLAMLLGGGGLLVSVWGKMLWVQLTSRSTKVEAAEVATD